MNITCEFSHIVELALLALIIVLQVVRFDSLDRRLSDREKLPELPTMLVTPTPIPTTRVHRHVWRQNSEEETQGNRVTVHICQSCGDRERRIEKKEENATQEGL